MILDTSYVIDLLKGEKKAASFSRKTNSPYYITSITVFELLLTAKKDFVKEFIREAHTLPLDEYSAAIAARIQRELKAKGKEIDPEDCMIAGIAIKHGKEIVTKNTKHFERIKSLKIKKY